MKIAQIAPLYESVPPKLYGGTERIVHYLTEELVAQGHQVTLFASGDSITQAKLVSNVDTGLRLKPDCIDPLAHHMVQLQEVIERSDDFDILHFHTDYIHFPYTQNIKVPTVTTLHGRLDIPDLQPLYNKFSNEMVISISESQKGPLPQARWIGTVHHGLSINRHTLGAGDGNYLAFVGRISPEKGLDKSIDIAIRSGNKLRIAAKVDKADLEYFETTIKHRLSHPLIEFIGEITDEQKTEFMGKAKALLFPIDWAEPFGIVMIEAMANGTPVIAFNRGSVPEVIDEGITGFIVGSADEAIEALKKIDKLSRATIRQKFIERFSAARMATEYVKLYTDAIQGFEAERSAVPPLKLRNSNQKKNGIIMKP